MISSTVLFLLKLCQKLFRWFVLRSAEWQVLVSSASQCKWPIQVQVKQEVLGHAWNRTTNSNAFSELHLPYAAFVGGYRLKRFRNRIDIFPFVWFVAGSTAGTAVAFRSAKWTAGTDTSDIVLTRSPQRSFTPVGEAWNKEQSIRVEMATRTVTPNLGEEKKKTLEIRPKRNRRNQLANLFMSPWPEKWPLTCSAAMKLA